MSDRALRVRRMVRSAGAGKLAAMLREARACARKWPEAAAGYASLAGIYRAELARRGAEAPRDAAQTPKGRSP